MTARPHAVRFEMQGRMTPLVKAVQGTDYVPSRPFGGWLCTYGQIGPRGIIPTFDRQGHTFEAAKAMGQIDFSGYLAKGLWNDSHLCRCGHMHISTPCEKCPCTKNRTAAIGVPTHLEHHGPHTELAKAHSKVGWWTEGHLFDRNDPRSWLEFTDHEPTETELDRADYFWQLAQLLKGTPRELGLSAEGRMLLSPCQKRIIYAKVTKAAVCEVPQNPDATMRPLALAVPIQRGMIGADACATCSCPAGACKQLRLAAPEQISLAEAAEVADPGQLAADLEHLSVDARRRKLARLVALLSRRFNIPRDEAARWVRAWVAAPTTQSEAVDG